MGETSFATDMRQVASDLIAEFGEQIVVIMDSNTPVDALKPWREDDASETSTVSLLAVFSASSTDIENNIRLQSLNDGLPRQYVQDCTVSHGDTTVTDFTPYRRVYVESTGQIWQIEDAKIDRVQGLPITTRMTLSR